MKKSFENWLARIDAIVSEKCGLSVHDLPDCPFRDWYDDGVSAASAAKRAIRLANE